MNTRFLCLLLLAGCVTTGRTGFMTDHGTQRASFEVKCPVEQLEVVEIDATTMGVAGCGKQWTYRMMNSAWKLVPDPAVIIVRP